jgi:hypothetical protein
MSSSSPEASPTSANGGGRHFSISRDKFAVDLPSPRLQLITNGNGVNGNGNLNSPNPLKSPNARRVQSFSREGILGSAQKARNLSQSSGDRESMTNGLQNRPTSDDGINPLKRRSTDAGVDYPRRRATIAVISIPQNMVILLTWSNSVRSVDLENQDVMAPSQSANSAQSWERNVYIGNPVSSSMLGTNSSWNTSPVSRVYFNRIWLAKRRTWLSRQDLHQSMEEPPSATMT